MPEGFQGSVEILKWLRILKYRLCFPNVVRRLAMGVAVARLFTSQ